MKIILPLSIAAILMTTAAHAQMKLPELKKQPTPQAVLDEHFAALNACDWDRLLAQYPEDAQIHLANGMIIKGRAAIGDGILQGSKGRRTERHAIRARTQHANRWHVCDPVGRDCALPCGAVPRLGRLYHARRLYEGHGLHLRRWRAEEEVSLPTIALVYLDVGRPEHSCTAKQTYAPRKTAGLFADNGETKFLARSCR